MSRRFGPILIALSLSLGACGSSSSSKPDAEPDGRSDAASGDTTVGTDSDVPAETALPIDASTDADAVVDATLGDAEAGGADAIDGDAGVTPDVMIPPDAPADSPPDAPADAAPDAAAETVLDVTVEATPDAPAEAAPDAPGDVPSEAHAEAPADGDGPAPASLALTGCTEITGSRPASDGSTAAPQVATLVLGAGTPGQPLTGSLAFSDPQADAVELLVQVQGSSVYYSCPISPADRTANKIDLGKLSLGPSFPQGTVPIYLSVRDSAGHTSGYVVGSLQVGVALPLPICGLPSIQLMGKIPSYSTDFYAQQNGVVDDYHTGLPPGGPLVIIGKTRALVDAGACTKLLLAGDSAGTKPLGWDNCLLIEFRRVPGTPADKRWYTCSYDNPSIYYVPTGQALPQGAAPTVPGTLLDPQVPNTAAFGHAAKALDIMSFIPSDAKTFELTLLVLDYGGFGSTTEIWALPQ